MSWEREVIELRDQGMTYPDIAEYIKTKYQQVLHPEMIRGTYRRRKKQAHVQKERVTFENLRTTDREDVEAFIEAMIALQEATDALDTKQVEGTIILDDDKPVGIAFWGDWHIGGKGVDYRLYERDRQTILGTDGLYVVGTGDYKDNYLTGTHPGSQYEQIVQPGSQDRIVLHYWESLRQKTLAIVRGCHDDWSKKMGDMDFVATCAERANALNFWHGGTLTLKLGDQTYTGHVRHKFKYESSLNTTNAQRRMYEIYGPADFAVLAHLHNPDIQERHLMGKYRWLVRSGTYKVWDEFAQKIGGYKGRPGVPVLIFHPDQRKIEGYRDLEIAVDRLKALRQKVGSS